MGNEGKRGSEKLIAAWKARSLTDESVRELAAALEKSPAKVEGVAFSGGSDAAGLQLSLRYDGDDGPWCGNDLQFLLTWLRRHGIASAVPRVIINGTPWPDLVRLHVNIGNVPDGDVRGNIGEGQFGTG
jgi:hypothetical protein